MGSWFLVWMLIKHSQYWDAIFILYVFHRLSPPTPPNHSRPLDSSSFRCVCFYFISFLTFMFFLNKQLYSKKTYNVFQWRECAKRIQPTPLSTLSTSTYVDLHTNFKTKPRHWTIQLVFIFSILFILFLQLYFKFHAFFSPVSEFIMVVCGTECWRRQVNC